MATTTDKNKILGSQFNPSDMEKVMVELDNLKNSLNDLTLLAASKVDHLLYRTTTTLISGYLKHLTMPGFFYSSG